ncbi:MAG: hypothetical protein ACOCYU_00105 [Brevefilum sp.]
MKRLFLSRLTLMQAFIVLLALSTALSLAGCDLLATPEPLPPTATSTATPIPSPTIDWFPDTPTPTFAAIVTPTPQPTLEGTLVGITELLVDDQFTDESQWQTPQTQSGNAAFGTQNLSLAVARPDTTLVSLSQYSLSPNFYLEMTVQTSLCEPLDQFGILFWHESNNDFYRLIINCAGQYRLELVQRGQNFVVHDWEAASQMALSAPATNRLALWVHNGTLQFFINDVIQFEEQIAKDRSGPLGVFARTVLGQAVTIRFSDLQIFRVEME